MTQKDRGLNAFQIAISNRAKKNNTDKPQDRSMTDIEFKESVLEKIANLRSRLVLTRRSEKRLKTNLETLEQYKKEKTRLIAAYSKRNDNRLEMAFLSLIALAENIKNSKPFKRTNNELKALIGELRKDDF